MKKLFAILGTNWTMIATLTGSGVFKKVCKITEPTAFTLTRVKQTGVDNGKFLDTLNTQNFTLVTPGNETTGEGFVYKAIYRNSFNRAQFALITVTTTGWNTFTATVQLCDRNGEVKPAVAETHTTAVKPPVGADLHQDVVALLEDGPVKCKTDLTLRRLMEASEGTGEVTTVLASNNDENYGQAHLKSVTGSSHIYTATSADKKLNYSLVAINDDTVTATIQKAVAVAN